MTHVLEAWRAGFARRWHGNYELSDTTDYNCGHQGRVALLVLALRPAASRALLAHAITHDQGEARYGDLSYLTKLHDPELAERHAALEQAEIRRQGFDLPNLTESEERLFKLCDRIDAWLWMMRHRRHLYARQDWQKALRSITDLAAETGLEAEVHDLIDAEVTG